MHRKSHLNTLIKYIINNMLYQLNLCAHWEFFLLLLVLYRWGVCYFAELNSLWIVEINISTQELLVFRFDFNMDETFGHELIESQVTQIMDLDTIWWPSKFSVSRDFSKFSISCFSFFSKNFSIVSLEDFHPLLAKNIDYILHEQ